MKTVDWSDLKAFVQTRSLSIQYVDLVASNRYWLAAFDGPFTLHCELDKTSQVAETADFDTNFKAAGNTLLEPKNTDSRQVVHSTPRKRGLFTCFTSAGDDQVDDSAVGGEDGVLMELHHAVNDSTTQTLYIDFNSISNETHAHAGWMMWKDALNDSMTLESVPKVTTYEAGTSTNYNLYGGYLIIPAAGNGTLTPLVMKLVEVPINEFGVRSGAGYWNATYNTSTKEFEDITASPTGVGRYNMFTTSVVLDRFVNRLLLLGSGQMSLDTYDASQLGHDMRLKITLKTRGADHDWWWNGGLKPFRKKTV